MQIAPRTGRGHGPLRVAVVAAAIGLVASGCGGAKAGLGALVGALLAAGGVAVVAVLVLRAMAEWRTIQNRAE